MAANILDNVGKALVTPVASLVSAPAGNLVLIPPRELHGIPFAPLFPGFDVWFARGLKHALRAPIAGVATTFVVTVGAPLGSTFHGLPPLPESQQEAESIAKEYPSSRVLVGRSATRSNIVGAIQAGSILHVATHGVSNELHPDRSFLVLSPEEQAADEAWGAQDPDWARLSKVALLVLSVCSGSATSATLSGAPMGLASSALAVGVSYVVASVAPARDDVAAHLMRMFHRRLRAGSTVAAALHAAQRETIGALGDATALEAWSFRVYL